MKSILTFIAFSLLGGVVFGQATRQGNVIIDPYYGFPNFGKSLANSVSDGLTDVRVTGYGPTGLRVEYMVGDRFGVGIDAIFNGFGVEGTSVDTTYNSSGQPIFTESSARATMNRMRFHARFNYHFEVTNPDLDVYMGLGAGTNTRTYKYFENDVEQKDETLSGALIPASLRICGGMRYYFTNNIGFNAELGLGGPLVSAGLSLKF